MYKHIILSKLREYLKKQNIVHQKSGNIIMVKCPFCNTDPISANIIPNTSIFYCHSCKTKTNLIGIAKKVENLTGTDEEILQHLKNVLKIKVITKKDEDNIDKYLDFYQKNGFDLVPIIKDGKRPIETNWTNKEHKDINEWKQWIVNGLNLGIKTGIRSQKTILDIDQKPIPDEIKKLMGDTLVQESTNGFHLVYQYEEDLPKTRIDDLKIDIENNGGQVVIYPSIINEIQRKIINFKDPIKMPKKLKDFLESKITVPRKTKSEEIREDISTEDFKINPKDFALKNNNLEGCCNSSFIKLGGILRKQLNIKNTGYVLHTLNKHLLENPMQPQTITAMLRELDRYTQFDESELAHRVIEYLKDVEEASRTEIAMAIVATNRGEDKKRVDKSLSYLVKEEYITKKGFKYAIIKKANWKTNLINIGTPINFKMPYFYDIMNFNYGDLILIGSKNATGKTHISMNIIKQLVKQGITPHYLSLESGSRWAKIALQLGLKEGDFKWDEVADSSQIHFEKKAITVVDWLCPNNYAETDKLLKYYVEKLQKTQGVAIVFVQLRDENTWLARDLIKQFPALACRYKYDNDGDGEYGKFELDKIRDPKIRIKNYEIPCIYNWESKELKRIDEVEKKKEE